MPVVADFPDVDKKDYQVLYPQYLDANLTTGEGRRMPLAKSCECPSSVEMYQVCMQVGVPVIFQPEKGYARQPTARRGRIKVLLKTPQDQHYIKKSEYDTATRSLINSQFPTKVALMAKMAEIIPTLPSRQKAKEEASGGIITTAGDKKKKKNKK
eukprot:TRINITY_DN2663_c2_g2_i1.p1 TRINITY_DN2663_c2_g2~~TRINITY_DN2663_c2_g2_i1.p1  ORF type:complete len:155 (+),score=17.52 TRINITY_DN2663_c2_g2_i1:65-529(+)